MLVEADGGSRGNPGPAGYGAVVLDEGGDTVLAERFEAIGVATNNVAEYRGLIAGLRAAAELGATEVDVRMDSKLVVEQMSGRWQIKHPAMKPLAAEAKELAGDFESVTYGWIPRERNKRADKLANDAMDGKAMPDPVIGEVPAGEGAAGGGAAGGGAAGKPAAAKAVVTERPAESAAHVTAPPASWSGAEGRPTRLHLVRHGQTELSVARRYSGRGNPPLTEVGLGQARAAAARLSTLDGVAAVVASPLQRTRQTAGEIAAALGLEVDVREDLIEVDFGEWEALTFTEAAERDPEAHARWLGDTSAAPPGGESFDAVHRRVSRFLEELAAEHAGSDVVVVSHVTPVKTLLRLALGSGPEILYRLHLDLASLSIAEFYPDGHASVRLVNDTSHLV
ncbi:bifunctional RNase H/acid phosphatase [Actinosynnema pretiosum subsp. pretiosum]|uniref:Bifunctional RNase H/acid phosphatase n=1 Tax=Actinosynnema pretiosum subsp. pretiosum TaxID=103721 RepID=A0AA45LEQ0_9PSEU|nr:bifunctional RNase H/acid phosphatase [Actinosynnema pretiosum subsp. pretiosum]